MKIDKILIVMVSCAMTLFGYSGWKESGISEAVLSSSTVPGTNLAVRTVYHVTSDVTLCAPANTSGLVLGAGVTVIDIATNCMLKVTGGPSAAVSPTGPGGGAGAGIRLPSGATLVVTGKGRLVAQGGAASVGGSGGQGVSRIVNDRTTSTKGGTGGFGGGGAGAAIGGAGGQGGVSGVAVETYSTGIGSTVRGAHGHSGGNGGNGCVGESCGRLVLLGDLMADLDGGKRQSGHSGSGGRSSSGIGRITVKKHWEQVKVIRRIKWLRFIKKPVWTMSAIVCGASGGGGGGDSGSVASFFGGGGGGGGGGGAGGNGAAVSAGFTWSIGGLRKVLLEILQHTGAVALRMLVEHGLIKSADGGFGAGWQAARGSGMRGFSNVNGVKSSWNSGAGGCMGASPTSPKSGELVMGDLVNLNYPGEDDGSVKLRGRTFDSGIVSAIAFNKGEGASGGSDAVGATLGLSLPVIAPPTRSGCRFDGYYTEPNGGGDRYFAGHGGGVRVWDIARENVTLYAHWLGGDCGIRVNGKNPSVDEIPGVKFWRESKVIVIDDVPGDDESFGTNCYVISGTSENGVRLAVRCATVCLSNLTIRLPSQTAEQIRQIPKIRIPFQKGGGQSVEKEYVFRSPLTTFRPQGEGLAGIYLLGTNLLLAEESGESGDAATSVPAISMFSEELGDYYTLVFDSGFGSDTNGFGRLELVAAGGAPALCLLTEATGFTGLRSGAERWVPVVTCGGTYEFVASTNRYDSKVDKHGECSRSYSPAIGLNGSLRSEIAWSKGALKREDPDNRWRFDFISELESWARPSFRDSCVRLTQPESAEPVKVNQGVILGNNGEVLVDVEGECEDGDVLNVVAYTSGRFDTVKSVFRSITPIDGVLHLWFDLQNTRYFKVNGVCYRAEAVAQTVWAERYEPSVMHVETGFMYHSLGEALAAVTNSVSATLRLLRDVDAEPIACALNSACRLKIDGGGHVISNALARSERPMFDVASVAELTVTNATLTGFGSSEAAMIQNAGRLRLFDCRLRGNDMGPDGLLVCSVSEVKNGVDFEADRLEIYDNAGSCAVYIDSPDDTVSSIWRSGAVRGDCTNGLCVASGRLDIGPEVDLSSAILMGRHGCLSYLGPPPTDVELDFFNPELREREKIPVVVDSHGYRAAATNFFVTTEGYSLRGDVAGNVRLVRSKAGSAFIAQINDLPEGATNETTAVTNYLDEAAAKIVEFDDYKDLPALFGPTVCVWATRRIDLEEDVTNEGATCAIDIPAGKFVDFGSVEFAYTNATDTSEKWDCDPVTLSGPVRVDGTLRIGNVIFSGLVTIGTNGTVIIGEEYPTNMPIRIGLPPSGITEKIRIRSEEYRLEDLLPIIIPGNRRYTPVISKDGNWIVFRPADENVVWVGATQGQGLYKSVAEAFCSVSDGEEVHLLSRPGVSVVKLDWPTALETNRNVVVNSGTYDGSGWFVGGMTTLDATGGLLWIGRDSSVRLTNVVVNGTLPLNGEGVLDLAGWTGNPVSVHPWRRGLIARNVPEGKLILGPSVIGELWRSTNGDVYYSAGGLVQWSYSQVKNGEGTLSVTNILGETTNFVLNAGHYASITNSGIANVQLDYPTLGYSTNLTVYVFYLDDETGRVFVPEGKGFQYQDENGKWKDFEFDSVAELESKRNAMLSKLGKHDASDGDIELIFDNAGNVVTNKPKEGVMLKLAAADQRIGLAAGMSAGNVAYLALDTGLNIATGECALHWGSNKFNIKVFDTEKARSDFSSTVGYLRKFIKITSAFDGSVEDGVNTLADQIADEGDKWLQKFGDAAVKEKKWPRHGAAAFATKAGIRAVIVTLADVLKYKRTPVQFGGKYYFPKNARLAYEACIKKNTDAAVHIQNDCELPPYVQTNGTLRLSGKFEGGIASAFYSMISNGKQWTSGETLGNAITHGLNTAASVGWGLFLFRSEEGFSSLVKTTGNAVGHFVSGLVKTIADPYGAVSKDRTKPLITVRNGAKLVMDKMTVPGNKDSGVQVSVENGGTAECTKIKLKKGYTLGGKAVEKGAFTAKSGATLTLKDVTAYEKCDVLCVENGALFVTLDGGEFNKAGFVLNGDALTMTKKPSGDRVWVSGERSTRDKVFAKKGGTKKEDWEKFRPAADDSLAAVISGENVAWGLALPIGNVKGGKLPSAIEFASLSEASQYIDNAGSGAEVTLTSPTVTAPVSWLQSVSGGTLTFNGNGNTLFGFSQKRDMPLFKVAGGGRLVLKNTHFLSFCGDVSLISAKGGILEMSSCSFDKNRMNSLVDFANQSNCTSTVTSVDVANTDLSSFAITSDSSGSTNRTIFVSGTIDVLKSVSFSGTGTVRVGKEFKTSRVVLNDGVALAYPDGMPSVPVGVFGTAKHLEGTRCIVDNSLSATKAAKESFVSLNTGYVVTNLVDGNLYLCNLRSVPPVIGNELVYTFSNDVFSVTNGYVPSVSDTNWTARTIAGTNAVFNAGRIARDAIVNSTNGSLVVNCRGNDFSMPGIGATDAQKSAAISNVLALVDEILTDRSAWFDGEALSNATKTALGNCVTKRELEVTAAEMTNALWQCAARFVYDGRYYLQGEAESLFDAASASEKPVTLLRDVTISPYVLASGTLNLVAETNAEINIFDNDIVRDDIVTNWSEAAQLDDELKRIEANVRCGIYSDNDYAPVLTVNGGAVASFLGIVCTNQYPCDSIAVEAGGLLKVDGDTRLTSVETDSGALEGQTNFTGVVGVSGRASLCGVSFGRNETVKGGEFYSTANDFVFSSDGKGALKWVLPEGFTLEDFAPEFAEEEPLSIMFATNDTNRVIVYGTVLNVESGLWYGFTSATNLTQSFETVPNSTMSTTDGEHRFRHEFRIEMNACGQVVSPTRFFKFRVSDVPPEK